MTSVEPGRGDLEASEVSGAKKRVQPEPIGAKAGVTQSQGVAQAQGPCHLRLHHAAGILRLDVRAEISGSTLQAVELDEEVFGAA